MLAAAQKIDFNEVNLACQNLFLLSEIEFTPVFAWRLVLNN